MADLAAIHAGQQSILRALAAQGEVLDAILEEITKPQKPSEVAEVLQRIAASLDRVEAKLDAQAAISGKERINGKGVP